MKPRLGDRKRIGEAGLVFLGAGGDLVLIPQLGAVENLDRPLRPHHRDFRRGPGVIDIAPDVLRAHDVIGTAIGLPDDDRDLGHGRLGKGEEQFGPVLDHPAMLLRGARQEARNIDQGEDRNPESVAEAHEPPGLTAGIDVETAGQHQRLVGDDADRLPVDADEGGDDIAGEGLLDLKYLALIGDAADDLLDVVGFVRIRREPACRGIPPPGRPDLRSP